MTLTIIGRANKKSAAASNRDLTSQENMVRDHMLELEAERFGSVKGGDFKKNMEDFHLKMADIKKSFANSEQAMEFCRNLELNIRRFHEKNPLIQGHINPTSLLDLIETGR